jgi:hypothetical protein
MMPRRGDDDLHDRILQRRDNPESAASNDGDPGGGAGRRAGRRNVCCPAGERTGHDGYLLLLLEISCFSAVHAGAMLMA